jgi:hypothetical protein
MMTRGLRPAVQRRARRAARWLSAEPVDPCGLHTLSVYSGREPGRRSHGLRQKVQAIFFGAEGGDADGRARRGTHFLEGCKVFCEGLVSRGEREQPPDCEAFVGGASAAIEVTELIYEKTAASRDHSMKHFVWKRRSFLNAIQARITEKGEKPFKGGPYARRMLVVYTNELYLPRAKVKRCLAGQRFVTSMFSNVVLGFSYHPDHRLLRPAFRLRLAKPHPRCA